MSSTVASPGRLNKHVLLFLVSLILTLILSFANCANPEKRWGYNAASNCFCTAALRFANNSVKMWNNLFKAKRCAPVATC